MTLSSPKRNGMGMAGKVGVESIEAESEEEEEEQQQQQFKLNTNRRES